MQFSVTTPGTNKIVATLASVDEAMMAEGSGFRVEAIGRSSVNALAAARIAASPDYNQAPLRGEEWVKFRAKSGRVMVCEVVRLTHPDGEGYPQLVELVNPARPDGSFLCSTSAVEVLDQDSVSPELLAALKTGLENGHGNGNGHGQPKLTKGLKK